MDENDNKDGVIDVVFERHRVFSSLNRHRQEDAEMLKKVRKNLKKRSKKSPRTASETDSVDGSSAPGTPLDRSESQISWKSSQSFQSERSSTNASNASQHQEFRQSRLFENWSIKFGTTWASLELVKERLDLINDMASWSPSSQEIQGLEHEFARAQETIQSTEDLGYTLVQSDSLDDETKESVQKDLDNLHGEWKHLKSQRYASLISRVEHQLESKEKHLHWKHGCDAAMVWIKEKNKELDGMDDLESSLVILEEAASKFESLYAEINSYQDKIENVVRDGRSVIKEEVESELVPSIRSDIRSLESAWEMLREKCTAVQLNIQDKVAMRQVEEKGFMTEWDETRPKIEDWLSNAESEAAMFDKAHDTIVEVEEQVAEHEELVFRLATEEKTVNDLLDVGENLSGKRLRSTENKSKVKSDLKALKKRKTKLNARLVGQQESLTSFLDHLARLETEAFGIWLQHCKNVEEKVLDLGKTEMNDNIDTVDGAKVYMQAEENLLGEIEALKPEFNKVTTEGNEAIAGGQLGKLKRQGVKTAMKSLKDLLEKKEQNATTRLNEILEELKNMQQQQIDQVNNWISKCETFDRWIDGESAQLKALLTSTDSAETLDKVLEEDQAIRDIQSNSASRTSILEALVKEGETLKENGNVKADLPDEHKSIVEKLVSIQAKWDAFQAEIKEKKSRVAKMVSAMQGQLLSVCVSQMDDLEKTVNSLGPLSDGYDTLAKDADQISEIFMMIGQTRGNVARFNKYANDLQTSEELSVPAKLEVREANEILHNRITTISANADERKMLLHEKIIDVLTESLVALNDTIGSLEMKCDELAVPDNLDTADLVERHSSLEDILKRLDACELSLKDIETLGVAADNSMILDSGEPEDITNEIEARKAFISHVQRMAREKRSRIYGLMIYSFKQRFDELNKLLIDIEDGLADESRTMPDIQTALEGMKNNEASLEELDSIQKSGEDLTMQVNELFESNVIAAQDTEEIQHKNTAFVDHLSDAFSALKLENSNFKLSFAAIVKEKLTELREWLDMMGKRREGDDLIGPDSMTIKKQIVEMNVVETQCKERRLLPDVHADDEAVTLCLDQDTIDGLREADHDWCHLSDWIEHRRKLLHATQDAWENFRQIEVNLLDYLRDIERQIKNWEPINLEDEEAVAARIVLLKAMLAEMETRKDDVSSMQSASEEVIEFIGEESPMTNTVKSQVSEIHDCWNTTVRQVIEAISKLNCAKEKLQNLEEGINEVRRWLDDAKSILKFYTPDIPDDVMEDLKPRVEKKCTETTLKESTLKKVNILSQELFDDIDGTSHDAIDVDLKNLNKDWNEVTTDLGRKKNMKKRPCCWWCYRRWFLKYGYYN